VLIAGEDIVLLEPEPEPSHLGKPGNDRFTPSEISRHAVLAWNVPHNVGRDQLFEQSEVARTKGICRSPVGECIGMIRHHDSTLQRVTSDVRTNVSLLTQESAQML
jgi:hypothetical protein